ncbi:MAG: oligosaccharide flippase family protein [Candidatus Omnitrophota bacterium]
MRRKIISREEKKTILENFSSLSALQTINYLLPLIILPYLIRVIGPEKFGLIAFAQALTQYFVILTDYGFSLSATKKIALAGLHRNKAQTTFSSVMTIKFMITAISFILFLIIISAVPKFSRDWMVYFLSFGTVTGNTLFPLWFFQGKEKMKYIAAINLASGAAYTISLFLLVKGPENYLLVPLLTSFFAILTGISGFHIAFKKFGLEFIDQKRKIIHEELKSGWSFFISIVAINAYTASRIFAVGLLTNNVTTGYYSIAERMASAIQTFPLASLSQAIYPRLSRIFSKSKKRAFNIMRRLQNSITLIYLIIIPIIFLLAPITVKIFCGQNYPEVTLSLRLLLISVFFVVSNTFRVQFLLVAGRPDIYAKIHIAAAIIGLPIIFLLIEYFYYPGAAVATIITEGGVLFLTIQIIKELKSLIS